MSVASLKGLTRAFKSFGSTFTNTKSKTVSKRIKSAVLASSLLALHVLSPVSTFMILGRSNAAFAADTGFKTPGATHTPNDFDVNTVANVQTSDDVYVSDNDGSEQGYSNFAFPAIPAGSTINGIEVSSEAKSTDSGSDCQLRVSLSWNNGTNYSDPIDATIDDTEGSDTFGGATNTWGRTWAVGDFTNANFVLKIQDRDPGNQCTDDAITSVDLIQVKVHYTDPATLANLSITKTNNVSGNVIVGNPFIWTLAVTNTGGAAATFNNQDIIQDNFPNSNVTIADANNLSVSTLGGVTGTIDCDISSSNLDCDDDNGGSSVVIPAGGSFSVSVTVTPTATGAYANPRSGGGNICRVDPDGVVSESNENNNDCSNTVTSNINTGTANPALPQACGLDIALVLDNSTSIDDGEMTTMKNAMTAFTNALNGTPTQFSVTRFATNASVLQTFTSNVATVNTAINGIPTGGGFTNWEDGFIKANSTLPNRPDKPNLVIFATDGDPTTSGDGSSTDTGQPNAHLAPAVAQANAIKGSGTRVLALGIGLSGDSVDRLKSISGPNADTGNVLTSDVITSDFANLAADLAEFANQTCGGTITTTKLIDADGVPGGATTPAQNWTFDINGGSNPAATQTDAQGQTPAVAVTPNTYSVNETQQAGYTLMSASCSGASNNGTTSLVNNNITGIVVAANNIVTCTFINTPIKGSIELKKTWVGTPGQTTLRIGTSENGTQVDSQLTGSNGSAPLTTGANQVNPGTYYISETSLSDYTATKACFVDANNNGVKDGGEQDLVVGGNGSVAVGSSQKVVCVIINSRNTGSVKVSKLLDNDGNGSFETTNPASFTWSLDGSGTNAMGSTVNNVNTGNHNVNENSVSGYSFVGWYNTSDTSKTCANTQNKTLPAQVGVTHNTTTDITLCNKRDTGIVSFLKIVLGGNSNPLDWTFNISDGSTAKSGDNKSYGTGNYTVTESGPDSALYNLTTASGICSLLNGTVTMSVTTQGGQCSITNTRKTGTLKIVKDVVNDNGGIKTSADFTFKVNGGSAQNFDTTTSPDGEKVLVVPTGKYTVVEPEANTMGYQTSYNNCADVDVVENQTTTCTITNNDVQPKITLVKVIDDNQYGDTATVNDFGLSIGGNAATSGQSYSKDAGSYAINEAGRAGYNFVNITGHAKCPQGLGGNVTLALGDDITCTIHNAAVQPKLKVVKQLGNQYGDTAVVSDFPLFVDGNSVTSGQSNGFNTGSHAISETNLPGYDNPVFSGDCDTNGNVSLALADDKTCYITNTAKQPKLVVTKHVINDNSGTKSAADFTMTVDGNSQAVPNFPGNENGTEVLLNEGSYSVDELVDSEYTKSMSGDCSGSIAIGETKYCTITNNDVPHPAIHVEKTGPGTAQAGSTVTYTFTVTNTGDVALANITVDDDIAGPATYQSGDTDTDDLLDLDETWIFTADYTIPANQLKDVVNTGTACGDVVVIRGDNQLFLLDEIINPEEANQVCSSDTHTTSIPQILSTTTTKPAVLANTGTGLSIISQILLPAILLLGTFGLAFATRKSTNR